MCAVSWCSQSEKMEKPSVKGECLCGTVRFEIQGEVGNLYQCHCSLCRKVTGAAANAATFVDAERFSWRGGEGAIRSFVKDSGYRADFCQHCSSLVPNPLRDTDLVWIPAGLLEDSKNLKVVAHLHTASRADWDSCTESAQTAQCFDSMPDLKALHQLLYEKG